MANYKVFSVQKRHQWLQKPQKKTRIKRRQAKRIGLWDAWVRRGWREDDEASEDDEG